MWEKVVGWESTHEVSSEGEIRNYVTGRTLNQNLVQGYMTVSLCSGGFTKKVYVHHLVCTAFVGLPPGIVGCKSGQFTVNHKDCKKTNNNVENLEWVTNGMNKAHALENGLIVAPRGESSPSSKLTELQVLDIRAKLKMSVSITQIAKDHGVVRGTIYAIRDGRSWKNYGL